MSGIDLALIGAGGAALLALIFGPFRRAPIWRATITPLASIIGSGFLVLGPIMVHALGSFAAAGMAVLCLVAWGFGMAMRDNIRFAEGGTGGGDRVLAALGTASDIALAGAYFISVAYYLNLFGAFALSLLPITADWAAPMVTSLALLALLAVGWLKGFEALERVEMVTVGVKLIVIAALLAGLIVFSGGKAAAGALVFAPPNFGPVAAMALGLGLIVTVQGFETSRYLGAAYDALTRVRSMARAQIIAAVIYILYVGLLSATFTVSDAGLTETAVIDMMATVAPALPPLLVLAALAAQASAAVADAGGAGGLAAEASGGRVTPRIAYLALALLGLVLTWGADVFQIIAYASRAFAAYYALQSLIAFRLAAKRGARGRAVLYAGMAALGVAAVLFAAPSEGH